MGYTELSLFDFYKDNGGGFMRRVLDGTEVWRMKVYAVGMCISDEAWLNYFDLFVKLFLLLSVAK